MKSTLLETEEFSAPEMDEEIDVPVESDDHEMASPRAVDTQRIAELAYRFWQERGCPYGSPEEDWYRAEAELQRAA